MIQSDFFKQRIFLRPFLQVVEKGGVAIQALKEPFTSSFKSDKFVLNN